MSQRHKGERSGMGNNLHVVATVVWGREGYTWLWRSGMWNIHMQIISEQWSRSLEERNRPDLDLFRVLLILDCNFCGWQSHTLHIALIWLHFIQNWCWDSPHPSRVWPDPTLSCHYFENTPDLVLRSAWSNLCRVSQPLVDRWVETWA